jgi:hypothetical protein
VADDSARCTSALSSASGETLTDRKVFGGRRSRAATPSSTSCASSAVAIPWLSAAASHSSGVPCGSAAKRASISNPTTVERLRSTIGWNTGRISAGSARIASRPALRVASGAALIEGATLPLSARMPAGL